MGLMVKGNSKLGPEVGIFNLPPIKTCTPSDWCLHGGKDGKPMCYALRGKHPLPNVVAANKRKLKESKRKDFVQRVVKEIKGRFSYVRIHASGDFYSDEYVQKWIDIAKQGPDILFIAFTKRRDLTESIRELNRLPNVNIRESLDKSRPKPEMGLKFSFINHSAPPRRKTVIDCHESCPECGYSCWVKTHDVILHEH